jgi:hypothetical protein
MNPIQAENIRPAGHEGYADACHAKVMPGISTRIHGLCRSCVSGSKALDRTFRLGIEVRYDSHDLSHSERIVSIGARAMTFDGRGTGQGKTPLQPPVLCLAELRLRPGPHPHGMDRME